MNIQTHSFLKFPLTIFLPQNKIVILSQLFQQLIRNISIKYQYFISKIVSHQHSLPQINFPNFNTKKRNKNHYIRQLFPSKTRQGTFVPLPISRPFIALFSRGRKFLTAMRERARGTIYSVLLTLTLVAREFYAREQC